MYKLLKK